MSISSHADEVARGERFEFGENWKRFLSVLDEKRIQEAERSLVAMLGSSRLDGVDFLDAGSGSGLFSLAAYRLGARVLSFDYDPASVASTNELRRRYCQDEGRWQVLEGSVLDPSFLATLGRFDVVYSWGVLHHTGDMWRALENISVLVRPGGQLFVAIYNDQRGVSRFWWQVKRLYCSGWLGKAMVVPTFFTVFALAGLAMDVVGRRSPLKRYREYCSARGMSVSHDWIDWLGGFPFEVATPAEVFRFFRSRGYLLDKLATTQGMGCNEFVFMREKNDACSGQV